MKKAFLSATVLSALLISIIATAQTTDATMVVDVFPREATIYPNQSVNFTAQVSYVQSYTVPPSNFQWYCNEFPVKFESAGNSHFIFTPTSPGVYNITVSVNGESFPATPITVKVIPVPILSWPPTPSPNLTPSATPTITPTPTATPTDFIYFDSGVTIYSPLNITYSHQNLVLNLSLCSAGILGGLDRRITMNYKIDNIQSGSVPLKSNGELHVATIAIGTVALPKLPEGSHNLTISLYGLNQRSWFSILNQMSNEPKYLSYENTVYFAINLSNNTQPTPTPIPTPSPSPSPTPTPLSSPTQQPTLEPSQSATPTAPPHSSQPLPYSLIITVAAVIVAISIVGLAVYFTKFRNKKTTVLKADV